ncbi:MAG: ABC transporter ATP-binding protein [Deltaproteobacteria bacterium RBG_13_60_28]|jgi:lipoprotein-releasing system ATP-binding protein|nr:MAG: ABC transporter ATP-binding protein [Deltaproteobacteria bacterium RBG_13_60_28]
MVIGPSEEKPVKIQIRGLSKTFRTNGNLVEVLQGVDLDIFPGETLAVVGASGVGKSTLLHILGTLERPSEGEVLWDGEEVFALDDRRLAAFRNRKVGFVFQFHHLLPEFNALENVMIPGLIARLPHSLIRERAETILVSVGLKERLLHRVSTLSGGEQQRVAVARALVLDPEVLLADEPTGNLDPKSGAQLQGLLLNLNRERGLTSVIVTHNMELARALDRRVTLMDGKAVILQGE